MILISFMKEFTISWALPLLSLKWAINLIMSNLTVIIHTCKWFWNRMIINALFTIFTYIHTIKMTIYVSYVLFIHYKILLKKI